VPVPLAINAAAAGAPWHLGFSYGRCPAAFMPQPVEGHDLAAGQAPAGPRPAPTAPLARWRFIAGSKPTG